MPTYRIRTARGSEEPRELPNDDAAFNWGSEIADEMAGNSDQVSPAFTVQTFDESSSKWQSLYRGK